MGCTAGRCLRRCCRRLGAAGDNSFIERNQSTVGELARLDLLGPTSLRRPSGAPEDSFVSVTSDSTPPTFGSELNEFFSFSEAEFDEVAHGFRLQKSFSGRVLPSSFIEAVKLPKKPRVNSNLMSSYGWAEEILTLVTQGGAQGMSRDKVQQRSATPLFVVAGTCPNAMASMQAVTFFRLEDGTVDLWWVKPMKADTKRLERETLNLQNSGPNKNDAGARAKGLFTPLIERYQDGGKVDGDFIFGIDANTGRAFIEDRVSPGRDRMLLYLVWQEYWSGFRDRKKFIGGKLCYQRSSSGSSGHSRFYTRQYKITDGDMYIAPKQEEESLAALFPPDSAQEMYDMQ